MSTEVIALIGSLIGAIVVMGAGLYWWMNRTPRVRRAANERLPLFGGDFDVDVEGNPLSAWTPTTRPASRPPSPAVERLRASTPPSSIPAVPEPPGGAGAAAAYRAAADAADAAPSGPLPPMEVFPSAMMPPTPPRSVTPVSSPVQPTVPSTPAHPRPIIRTFTTQPRTSDVVPPLGVSAEARSPVSTSTLREVGNAAVAAHGVPGTMIEGHLLRFSVPAEGTLQFLPGRLEIAAGRDSGREIRFVRVPGPNGNEVTFGRSEGELYRHIQLRDQTVSRSHARMRLVDGTWHLLNLSQTNPVVHNGYSLTGGEERPVSDGDRIEMGEVLFTFRSR
jgi:hypothetical protein